MGQLSADFVVQDAVIPKRALAELLQLVYDEADAAGIRAVNVFHAGDGNLHPNFLFDSRKPGELERVELIGKRLMQRVVDVGGTLSGEHGIGNDKTAYMPLVFGPEMTRIQLSIPAMFNPRHQLNPLKVFAGRRFEATNGSGKKNGIEGTNGTVQEHGTEEPGRVLTSAGSRCFVPFLDLIDGVLCLPATATAADIQAQASAHQLRFPLLIDNTATLRDQVDATGFAPASSRFGPFCDNIVGMNWKLPNGHIVRIGERVVKTTTGYDLFRFLLGSGRRFGEPVDYVLRLRPNCGVTSVHTLSGPAVTEAIPRLLANCWMHWFDSIDYLVESNDPLGRLRIVVNCPADECRVFESYLSDFAKTCALSFESDPGAAAPTDGCPDFVFKTSPEHVIRLAREVAEAGGVRCVVLCYNGVVNGYIDNAADRVDRITALAKRFAPRLQSIGGDWQSRHLPAEAPTPLEAGWIFHLEQESNQA